MGEVESQSDDSSGDSAWNRARRYFIIQINIYFRLMLGFTALAKFPTNRTPINAENYFPYVPFAEICCGGGAFHSKFQLRSEIIIILIN